MTQMNGRPLNRKERRMFASNKFKAKQERQMKEVKPLLRPSEAVAKEYGNACAAYGDAKLRESLLTVQINDLWRRMVDLNDEFMASKNAENQAAAKAAAQKPEVANEESQSVPS